MRVDACTVVNLSRGFLLDFYALLQILFLELFHFRKISVYFKILGLSWDIMRKMSLDFLKIINIKSI